MSGAAALTLEGLSFGYDATMTVKSLQLSVRPGELVTLVGPSGCGKSTLLKLVAGLLDPQAGRILIDNEDVRQLPPEKRRIGWMPQSYALFEHLNVIDNVAFGLKMQGVPKGERLHRAEEVLELCRVRALAKRPVTDLSGGQRQRVAVARALAVRPRILLLDEPLAALDPQLRLEVRAGLERLLRASGVTTLFVTHDQDEALALADRVAVLNEGRLEQFATPETVWQCPASPFVAKFTGNAAVVTTRRLSEDEIELLPNLVARHRGSAAPVVALRPVDLELSAQGAPLTVTAVAYAGGLYELSGQHATGVTLRVHSEMRANPDDVVHVALRPGRSLSLVGSCE